MRRPRSMNGTANGRSVQLSVRSRPNSRFGGFSAISDLIVYRLTDDDDAIVEDGFQVRQRCEAIRRVRRPQTWKRAARLSGLSKSFEPAQPYEQLVRFGAP